MKQRTRGGWRSLLRPWSPAGDLDLRDAGPIPKDAGTQVVQKDAKPKRSKTVRKVKPA